MSKVKIVYFNDVFLGITQHTILTYPPGVAMLLCEIIDKCREKPPTNWSKSTYELIMREDLASQSLNTFYHNKTKGKDINIEKLIDWNDGSETDGVVKDGMECLDDEVNLLHFL